MKTNFVNLFKITLEKRTLRSDGKTISPRVKSKIITRRTNGNQKKVNEMIKNQEQLTKVDHTIIVIEVTVPM